MHTKAGYAFKSVDKGGQTIVTAAPLRREENEIRIIRVQLTNGPFKLGRIMARKEEEIQDNKIKNNVSTDGDYPTSTILKLSTYLNLVYIRVGRY